MYALAFAAGFCLAMAIATQSPVLKNAKGNERFARQAAECMAFGGYLTYEPARGIVCYAPPVAGS